MKLRRAMAATATTAVRAPLAALTAPASPADGTPPPARSASTTAPAPADGTPSSVSATTAPVVLGARAVCAAGRRTSGARARTAPAPRD